MGRGYTSGPAHSTATRSDRSSLEGLHGWVLLRTALHDRGGQAFSAPAVISQGRVGEEPDAKFFRVAFGPDARFASEEGSIYENPKSLAYRMMVKLSDHVVYTRKKQAEQESGEGRLSGAGQALMDGVASIEGESNGCAGCTDATVPAVKPAPAPTRPRGCARRLLAWSRASSPELSPRRGQQAGLRAAPSCEHGLDAGVAAVEPRCG